jgi:hypothetical protein
MEYFKKRIQEMRDAGESVPPIDVLILKVNVIKWDPMPDKGTKATSPFTPTKSGLSQIC